MPFYEYQCGDCDHRLEVLQKITDEPLIFCPQCNEASLKKLISATVFRLKGSGWYETDFKNSGQKKEKSADKTSADVKSASSSSSEPGSSEPGSSESGPSKPGPSEPSDKKADTDQSNKSGADKGVPTSPTQRKGSASSAAT